MASEQAGRAANAVMPVAVVGLAGVVASSDPAIWTATWPVLTVGLSGCAAFFIFSFVTRRRRAWDARVAARAAMAAAVPLAWLSGLRPPTVWLAGTVWVLAFAERSRALPLLGRVLARERQALAGVATLFAVLLSAAALAAHLAEGAAQPAAFGTLPRALWWAVTTATTTGYGDSVPRGAAGRLIAAAVMVCGLGVFGLFTGILATGFAEEGRRQDFLRTWDLVIRVPFFAALPAEAIAALAEATRRLDVPGRAVLTRRGRMGDRMYFIVAGEVEVDVIPPARLGPGAFFGEMALLGDGTRTATVTATRPTTLLALDAAEFRRLAARSPDLAEAIAAEARRRGLRA